MGSELQALERVERTGEKPNETQKAFQAEYLQLVQNRQPSGGDQQIIILGASDKTSGTPDKPAKQGPETPMDRLEKAAEEYMKTGKLTPELRKRFEGVVAESDKGPSPRIPVLEKQIQGLADEAKAYFTQEKQQEAKTLQDDINTQVSSLSEQEQQGLKLMLFMRALTPPDERKEMDDAIEKMVPGLMDKSKKLEAVMGPVREKYKEAMSIQEEIELEKKANIMSRVVYAEVLLDAGDEKGAQKLIREAAVKDQKLLDSEYFVDLAERAGLERKMLIVLQA